MRGGKLGINVSRIGSVSPPLNAQIRGTRAQNTARLADLGLNGIDFAGLWRIVIERPRRDRDVLLIDVVGFSSVIYERRISPIL
jgi:hypothetical protein